MPNLPYKFLLFIAVGVLSYMFVLPKRANFVSLILHRNSAKETPKDSREEKIKALAMEKVRNEICTASDFCKYRVIGWSNFYVEDEVGSTIVHEFFADDVKRKFRFRMRYSQIAEVNSIY